MTVLQPSDETPLPTSASVSTIPKVAAAIPGIKQELTGDIAAIKAAADEHITHIANQLGEAYADVATQANIDIAQASDVLKADYDTVMKNAGKVIKSTKNALDKQYADMWSAGVKTPVTVNDILTDLDDATNAAITARFSESLPPPMRPEVVPIVDGGPTLPPGTITHGGVVLTCPVGQHMSLEYHPEWRDFSNNDADPNYTWVCVPDLIGDPGPPLPPPPVVPPPTIIPPPGIDPGPVVVPPPGIDPGPTTIRKCDESSVVTEKIACYTVPPPVIKLKYWVTVDCSDCNNPKVCVWKGLKPPVTYDGMLQGATYDNPPTQDQITAFSNQCVNAVIGGIVSPPPSPPPGVDPPPDVVPPPDGDGECKGDTDIYFVPPPDSLTMASAPNVVPQPTGDILEDFFKDAFKHLAPGVCIPPAIQPTKKPCDTWSGGPAWDRYPYLNKAMEAILNTPPIKATNDTDIDRWAKRNFEKFFTSFPTGLIRSVTLSFPTKPVSVYNLGVNLAIANRIEAVTGYPMSYESQSTRYAYQFGNPQYLPGQAEADMMWLLGKINEEEWCALTKSNGNIPTLFDRVRESKEVKPNVNDVISLYRRGSIISDAQLQLRLRELGVIKPKYIDEFLKATESIPQPPDIIRFMVRDVFDPAVVADYDLDAEFKEKYTETSEKLGKAAGLSNDTARYEWRAHWRVPSDTALYDMVHRLRPNRFEVQEWDTIADTIGKDGAKRRLGERPPVFTVDDLKKALKINDNLPKFVDSLTAISYRPITNTDASRMYELGSMDESKLSNAFQDNGYTKKNADILVDFYKSQKLKRQSNLTGALTPRKVLQYYKAGSLTRQQADDKLKETILIDLDRMRALDDADVEMKAELQKQNYRALRKGYLYGIIDEAQLQQNLINIGFDPARVPALLEQLKIAKFERIREPRLQMLCEWFTKGFMDVNEYARRLVNMGFKQPDIERIIGACASNNVTKLAKEAAALADKQRVAIERTLRNLKQNMQQQLKNLEQAIKEKQAELDALSGQHA